MKIKLADIDRDINKKFNFSVSSLEGVELDGELHVDGMFTK